LPCSRQFIITPLGHSIKQLPKTIEMQRKAFIDDKNVGLLLNANSSYDRHLKALRNIYRQPEISAPSRQVRTAHQLNLAEVHRRNKMSSFRTNQIRLDRHVSQENNKMLKNLRTIASRPLQTSHSVHSRGNQLYQDNMFNGRLNERKKNLERLDVENRRLADGIRYQKGMVNIRELEQQYQKNKYNGERIRKLKVDPSTGRTILSGRLIYEDGRFRKSGSSYLSIGCQTPRSSRSSSSNRSIKLSANKINFKGNTADKLAGESTSRPNSRASRVSSQSKRSINHSKPSLRSGKALGVVANKAPVFNPGVPRQIQTASSAKKGNRHFKLPLMDPLANKGADKSGLNTSLRSNHTAEGVSRIFKPLQVPKRKLLPLAN
jgi:hypothetical protein